jgi:hypothetical protein
MRNSATKRPRDDLGPVLEEQVLPEFDAGSSGYELQ